ncbi:TPA: hypothetical protein MB809_005253 [Klebsiella pneumoniae]|jgi:hypothetical protein|uniref:hypothetical protein n=1 Tax=Enterobacteriaceae TaxID=543 RepID=UPI0018F67D8D|nr:hypothetical protein [Enterobacter roggenkampii]EIM5862999.1 hypothetical protein [Salmonella enterica]EIX9150166.1 hypothetical protein [Klebsiella pneumoniae]HBQ6784152.1 hypothetical protein [Klebsiella pneumoniae]HBT5028952.1 hypothetical protein [Klebsiella pneumoniae]HBT5153266.1 hypothetical protein [Klebsiella pneumoniae]
MKPDNVILTVDRTKEQLFYRETTYEITPHELEDKGSVYFSVNKNSFVSWGEWNSCLEVYKVTKPGEEYPAVLEALKINDLSTPSPSFELVCEGFNHIADTLSEGKQEEVKKFLGYVKNAVSHYKSKKDESQEELTPVKLYSSAKSFIEFMRYIPAFYNKLGIKVYIDDRTGFFGVIYKRTSFNAGTLNILVKDNHEIDFSFAKRRKGVVTITGVAKFGKHLDNSDQIRSVFKLME